MARFGRAGLIALGLLAGWNTPGSPAAAQVQAQNLPVTLNIHHNTGVTLKNLSDKPLSLRSAVLVQQWTAKGWNTLPFTLQLIDSCPAAPEAGPLPSDEKCTTLAPQASLQVICWTGYSCAGQCPASCRANIYYGPGKFRFGVESCKGSRIIYSPAFELPEQAKE